MAHHQAQDTFHADMPDGSKLLVTKGAVFASSHPVVKLDAGRGLLFKPLPEEDDAPPRKARPSRAKAAAAADDADADAGDEA